MVVSPAWSARAHFPDGSFEVVTVHEEPREGATFIARDAEWRITAVRMPEDDAVADYLYEVDVEPADE
jgi:hypothetical protein